VIPKPGEYVTLTWPLAGGDDVQYMTVQLPYPMTEEQWTHFMQYIELLKGPMLWRTRQGAAAGNPDSPPDSSPPPAGP